MSAIARTQSQSSGLTPLQSPQKPQPDQGMIFEVFRNPLSPIIDTISSYIPEHEMRIIKAALGSLNPLWPIDLSNPDILMKYLGKTFQTQDHLDQAELIVKSVYGSKVRPIGKNGKNGFSFPAYPEVLAYAMQLAKGQTVLEIAAAGGENAILLAFAGAAKVYANDIEPAEMESFKGLASDLTPDVGAKLEAIEGNCFDILKKQPNLSKQVGLVICRSLIHFFGDTKQAEFMSMLKTLLKPGGRAIITTNSMYRMSSRDRHTFQENPNATTFRMLQCLITDFDKGLNACAIPFTDYVACSEHLASLDVTSLDIYESGKNTEFKWQVKKDAFNTLDPSIRSKISTACNGEQELLKTIKQGTVRVLTQHIRIYNATTLQNLFKSHGFEIETTFAVTIDGHLINDVDLWGKCHQVGVIVKTPQIKKTQ